MSVSEKKIAVVLAGCGVFDGSEIHEATCTLLNIAAFEVDDLGILTAKLDGNIRLGRNLLK